MGLLRLGVGTNALPISMEELDSLLCNAASTSILVKGSPTPPFKLQRELRQGDPLSPFLFDLVVESLSQLIQKATSLGLWEGIEVCKNGFKLSHLQYWG